MSVSEHAPSRRRTLTGWVVIGALVIGVGLVGTVIAGSARQAERDALDPESAAPLGTRAIAQVLRDHGVDVVIARSRGDAVHALSAADSTLVLPDAPAVSDGAYTALLNSAADVVLVDPHARDLRLALPGTTPAGVSGGASLDPDCDLPAAERAGSITAGAVYAAGPGASGCYPDGEGGYALVTGERIAAVDGRSILVNEKLAANGNAALAVNLLAAHGRVVWYVPSIGDSDLTPTHASLGDLTPGWVTPAIVVLLGAALAAALWRGRRFGPLVAERLPVTVPASETVAGRARLYERSRDRLHAADQLRAGTLERLGRVLGLGPAATAADIADAAADRLRTDRRVVRGILLDDVPTDDRELVELSDRLRDLETATRASARPERNRP